MWIMLLLRIFNINFKYIYIYISFVIIVIAVFLYNSYQTYICFFPFKVTYDTFWDIVHLCLLPNMSHMILCLFYKLSYIICFANKKFVHKIFGLWFLFLPFIANYNQLMILFLFYILFYSYRVFLRHACHEP